jgi:SulP family sulfate permease
MPFPPPDIAEARWRFQPRLWQHLRAYNRDALQSDIGAGITVGIVALPLAMAFAIASGLTPQAGLWTAIVGGFLISFFGGSSVQIGGPAGAFIVVVYGIVERYGLGGLLLSTGAAGCLLFLMGWFRLGSLVRYVPVSIVIGFTNGIAVLILVSQLRDWFGLEVAKMPGDFFAQMAVIWAHLDTFNPAAFLLTIACFVGLWLWPRLFAQDSPILQKVARLPRMGSSLKITGRVPGPIVALVSLTLFTWLVNLPVETIGQRFGEIPRDLPTFIWPEFSWVTAKQLVWPTLTLTILGAIESLLCARVADQLSDVPKHNPNQELMAQGIANFTLPFIGGMPATGTIARTVTNIRAGARSPIAGIVHATTLAVIVLAAAPLAAYIPLSVLAGILIFVAFNMGEWHAFRTLRQYSGHYRLMLLSTFLITVIFDLTLAIEFGLVLAFVLFIKRQSALFTVHITPTTDGRTAVVLYGSLFFGVIGKLDTLQRLPQTLAHGSEIHVDATRLISLDTTGLDALKTWLHDLQKASIGVHIHGLQPQPASLMKRTGFLPLLKSYDAEETTQSTRATSD